MGQGAAVASKASAAVVEAEAVATNRVAAGAAVGVVPAPAGISAATMIVPTAVMFAGAGATLGRVARARAAVVEVAGTLAAAEAAAGVSNKVPEVAHGSGAFPGPRESSSRMTADRAVVEEEVGEGGGGRGGVGAVEVEGVGSLCRCTPGPLSRSRSRLTGGRRRRTTLPRRSTRSKSTVFLTR